MTTSASDGSVTQEDGSLWKGALAGAVAGAAGAFVMEKFQTKALPRMTAWLERGQQEGEGGGDGGGDGGGGGSPETSEPATLKAAEAVSEKVFRHELTEDEKKWAGPAAHYWMGVTSGAVYGATVERLPLATIGQGAAFGTMVWGIADEGVVPLAGLSKPPTEYPAKTHASALASHLVYGVTTEMVRRAVRRAL